MRNMSSHRSLRVAMRGQGTVPRPRLSAGRFPAEGAGSSRHQPHAGPFERLGNQPSLCLSAPQERRHTGTMRSCRSTVTQLGLAHHRYGDRPFSVRLADLLSHLHVIGQTGTGNLTLLRNLRGGVKRGPLHIVRESVSQIWEGRSLSLISSFFLISAFDASELGDGNRSENQKATCADEGRARNATCRIGHTVP